MPGMCFVKYCEALRYYPLLQSDVLYVYEYCRNTKPLGRGKEFFIVVHKQLNTAAFFPYTQTHRLRRELMKSFCVSGRLYPTDTGESMMDFLPCLYTGLGQPSSPPEKRKHFFCCFPLSLYRIHFCVSGGSGFLQKH